MKKRPRETHYFATMHMDAFCSRCKGYSTVICWQCEEYVCRSCHREPTFFSLAWAWLNGRLG